jgi:hypothetical protein
VGVGNEFGIGVGPGVGGGVGPGLRLWAKALEYTNDAPKSVRQIIANFWDLIGSILISPSNYR